MPEEVWKQKTRAAGGPWYDAVPMTYAQMLASVALGSLLSAGCYRGYKSPKELDSDERGPKACAASCKELRMQMSAFVLVERQTSACVCSPAERQAQPAAPAAAAAAASQAVTEQKKREADQQREQQTVVAPP